MGFGQRAVADCWGHVVSLALATTTLVVVPESPKLWQGKIKRTT